MRIFKILGIVVVSIIALYYLLEFACYNHYIKESYPYSGGGRPYIEYYKEKIFNFFKDEHVSFDKMYEAFRHRRPMGLEYDKSNPIIIFGGSFAFGNNLRPEGTFQNALAQGTKSTVYNFSNAGWAPNNMLYQLKRDDFYLKVAQKPSAIVYLYMCADSTFLFREVFINENQVFYDDTEEGLVLSKFSAGAPFYGYTARQIRGLYAEKFVSVEQRKIALIRHFLEAKKEVNKRWGDVPFNILVYSYMPEEELDSLETLHHLGFNVQFAEKLTNEDLNQVKYQVSEYDMHPNELAWKEITPKFIENMKRN